MNILRMRFKNLVFRTTSRIRHPAMTHFDARRGVFVISVHRAIAGRDDVDTVILHELRHITRGHLFIPKDEFCECGCTLAALECVANREVARRYGRDRQVALLRDFSRDVLGDPNWERAEPVDGVYCRLPSWLALAGERSIAAYLHWRMDRRPDCHDVSRRRDLDRRSTRIDAIIAARGLQKELERSPIADAVEDSVLGGRYAGRAEGRHTLTTGERREDPRFQRLLSLLLDPDLVYKTGRSYVHDRHPDGILLERYRGRRTEAKAKYILVLDVSGSMAGHYPKLRRYLTTARKFEDGYVILFSHDILYSGPIARLPDAVFRTGGGTSFARALAEADRVFGRTGRTRVLFVSDGYDLWPRRPACAGQLCVVLLDERTEFPPYGLHVRLSTTPH